MKYILTTTPPNVIRIMILKALAEYRELNLSKIKTLSESFDVNCDVARRRKIVISVLGHMDLTSHYTPGECGMTILSLVKHYPGGLIPLHFYNEVILLRQNLDKEDELKKDLDSNSLGITFDFFMISILYIKMQIFFLL